MGLLKLEIAPKVKQRYVYASEPWGFDSKVEASLESLGIRERRIASYRERRRFHGQIDVDGLRHGPKKTIEESVAEWRALIPKLADK